MLRNERHKRIAKIQAKVAGIMLAVVVSLGIGSAGTQVYSSVQVDDAIEQVDQRVEFWQVVDGSSSPTSGSAKNNLASDLRQALGAKDPEATKLPQAIRDFRAGPNTYGGVKDDLGFDPFDAGARACDECGALTSTVQNDLLLIKQGKLDVVLKSERAAIPEEGGYSMLPFDGIIPNALFWAAIYSIGSTSALIIAVRRDAQRNGYRPNMVQWTSDGGSTADRYRAISRAISPLYFSVVIPLSRRYDKTKDIHEVLKDARLDEVDRNLREVQEALQRLPVDLRHSAEADELRHMVEVLQGELERQAVSFDEGFNPLPTQAGHHTDLDQLRSRIRFSASALEARSQARAELGIADAPSDELRGITQSAGGS